MSCENCNCDSCDCDLGLPVGEQGEAGKPLFINLSYIVAGAPLNNSTTTFVEAGRFVFNKNITPSFTAMKNNIWVTGGTAEITVVDLVSGNTMADFPKTVTSVSPINVETYTGLSIYPVANDRIISVQIKHQTGGVNSVRIGSSIFYYG